METLKSSLTNNEISIKYNNSVRRVDVGISLCDNNIADDVFKKNYWMQRTRRSRRLSYEVYYSGNIVAWVQCADPFGTKLAKPLQKFDINDAVEVCRGFFIDEAPNNIESCALGMVLRSIPNDWNSQFGVVKKIAIIYQDHDVGQKGIVYKALGFLPYGECKRARYYREPTRGNSKGKKIIWARALRPVSGKHYLIEMPINKLCWF